MRFVLALLALGLSGAAVAQTTDAERALSEEGRYVVERSNDGFTRRDQRTGLVSACRESAGIWVCETPSERGQALEEEIGRLAGEIDSLRRRLADARAERPGAAERPTLDLPTREDLDKVAEFLSRLADRVGEFVGKVQREFEQRNE